VAGIAGRTPGRFIPIGSAWPQQGAEGVAEARRCLEELGMKGLKFHPWAQGFSVFDPFLGEMCALAGQRNAPVIFHDGTPCNSLSEQIGGLARQYPGTRFVLGHAGLLWNWRSVLEAARQPNVWVCLCGPHQRAIEILCQRVNPARLLWGSDFGFGFTDFIGYRLGLIRQCRISDELRARILDGNPHILLNGE
jgi:uncharacterized protein